MARTPKRGTENNNRPQIWAEGSQRPPFDVRALGRASLFFSRQGVATLHAWLSGQLRRGAVGVSQGKGRIPEARLGRIAPYVPSHLRVAMWIRNLAATIAHASAAANPDVTAGNAFVRDIEQPLWPAAPNSAGPDPSSSSAEMPEPVAFPSHGQAPQSGSSLGTDPRAAGLPSAPGPAATTVIQVIGWLIGWASAVIALPYGLIRALWRFASGEDLRKVGQED